MGHKRETLPRVNSNENSRRACQRAWDACSEEGVVLPETRLAGGRVWPVVRWNEFVLRDRLARRAFAVMDRVIVRDWVVAASGESVPLKIEGFVFTGALAQSMTPMSTLAPLGRMVWLSTRTDDWSAWACELGGFWQVDAATQTVVTRGSGPPELPVAVGAVGRRLLVEQLFDLAAREDCLPFAR